MSQPLPRDGRDEQVIVRDTRVRRPGARRRQVLGLFVVAVVAGLLEGAYFFLRPTDTGFVLHSYTYAAVERKDLSEILQLPGTIGYSRISSLVSPTAGSVVSIGAQPGDEVAEGQVVARLSSDTAQRALQDDTAQLGLQVRTRDRLTRMHTIDVASHQRAAAAAQAKLQRAQGKLDNSRQLLKAGAATASDVSAAEDEENQAQLDLETAQAGAASGEINYEFDLGNASAEIDRLTTAIQEDKRTMEALTIRSPIHGRLIEVLPAAGSLVADGAAIAAIADLSSPVVTIDVPESSISRLVVGKPVSISTGGDRYNGHISRIAAKATGGSSTTISTVAVKAVIEVAPGTSLVPGVSADVTITLDTKHDVLSLPRGQFLTTGGQVLVYRIDGTEARKVPVGFGIISATDVEVASGLSEGDRVVTSGYQEFMAHDVISLDTRGGKQQ